MIAKKRDRPEQIRALRRQGLSVSDICERIGVTRQTVWRHSKGIEPVPPTPTPAPAPDSNGHVDLEMAQSLGLGVLVQRAQAGSVSAAAHVFKAASAEIRANKCVNHLPIEDVITSLKTQYHLWVLGLKGSFTRRLLMEYEDLDPGQLEGLIDDEIDSITTELNRRFESEDNHE